MAPTAIRAAMLVCVLAAGPGCVAAQASPASAARARPHFSVSPGNLQPRFAWRTRDYVVRCDRGPLAVRVRGARDWRAGIASRRLRSGSYARQIAARPGRGFTVAYERRGAKRARRFHVRCLPSDFPPYGFSRRAPGGPRLFFVQLTGRYTAIFDRHGVPVWWFKASGETDNSQVLGDGTIAWDPVDQASYQTGDYQVRTLTGRLLRTIRGREGSAADVHELLLLPNGNYLLGAQVIEDDLDLSPYGGPPDASAYGIEVQETTPDGRVVWSWDSSDHIGLGETAARWWPMILKGPPYDIVHWNAAEPDGRLMLLSFRHLDAVYAINRRTGRIVWKLGGTRTAKSLRVLGDPMGSYPLGGQHDVRALPDGTITIYDNETNIAPPRVVRYRIDLEARTARLIQSFGEPQIKASFCCGSARRLSSGDWLVAWGGTGLIGGYDGSGRRLFALRTPGGFSYRANPVAPGVVRMRSLRHAMDVMACRGGAHRRGAVGCRW